MSVKGNDRKELKKKLQQYLKQPSEKAKPELIEAPYLPVFASMWRKLTRAKLDTAVGLLAGDKSDGATQMLRDIASEETKPVDTRLKAMEALDERGEDIGDSASRSRMQEMLRAAERNDAQGAGELAVKLDTVEIEAWAALLVEKEAVDALTAAALAVTEKRSIKAFKRAAHELRAKGIEAPEWEEKGASALKPPEKDEPTALGTITDGYGKQVIFLYLPVEAGGVHVAQAILDETNGFEDYQAATATRGSARSLLKKLRSEIYFLKIPVEHAAYVLDRSAARASEKGFATSPDYAQTRRVIKDFVTDYEPPDPGTLIDGEITLADTHDAIDLFESPFFKGWVPDADSLNLCQMRLDQALSSTLVISEAQRLEQIGKAFEDSAKEYLEPENRANFIERLKEAARLLFWNDKIDEARKAIAVAEEIEKPESVPRFVVEMFRRLFPDAEKASLERGALPSEEEPGKSDGGIIIP